MAKHLVIVESPAKARTIKRFLGKDYVVEASMGHIRDLPGSGLGVAVENDFEPTYEVSEGKETVVKNLKAALKETGDLWIATDEDREGEAIGWHLTQALKIKEPEKVKRIVFHEITEEAIKEAIAHPRTLDMNLVQAQQARRILDRLVGYTLSPFLWKKVYSGLSAGRVQSVSVSIIVIREREIRAFVSREYWSLDAEFTLPSGDSFIGALERKNDEKLTLSSKEETDAVLTDLADALYAVATVEEKEVERTPPAPFTTSTLQQEASRKLGFSVKQTMVVAQQLYEGINVGEGGTTGLITYMRTDSVNLSTKALKDAVDVIGKQFGREYILSQPRTYKSKNKSAQEAHEAIRPTELSRTPASLAGELDHQQLKLYTLIWNRTMATQMPAAVFKRVGADILSSSKSKKNRYTFRATGQTVVFDGFLRVYSESHDEPEAGATIEEEGEKRLPPLQSRMDLGCEKLDPQQHFTKPPPRYTEASLVKKLEEEGIGRPSTYAPTISTIQQRGYIRKEGRTLVPEDIAFTVCDLLKEHFSDIVDLQFTANMEQSLDNIAEGKDEWRGFLKTFYDPFRKLVESKTKEINKSDVLKERVLGRDPVSGKDVIVRMGRFGAYVQLGKMEEVAKEKAGMRSPGKKGAAKKGPNKKSAKALAGIKTASVPKTMSMESVTLDQALSLLAFPRSIGRLGEQDVLVNLGRFGPYVKCGEVTVSLPKDVSPVDVTLEQALQFIKDKEEMKTKAGLSLKTFDSDPVSGKQISVKDGRYGLYVTDGITNASLPKDKSPEQLTMNEAVALLAKRRGVKKRVWRKKA